jgi:sRNA-binding carbon storage regulator CsrA
VSRRVGEHICVGGFVSRRIGEQICVGGFVSRLVGNTFVKAVLCR